MHQAVTKTDRKKRKINVKDIDRNRMYEGKPHPLSSRRVHVPGFCKDGIRHLCVKQTLPVVNIISNCLVFESNISHVVRSLELKIEHFVIL